MRNTVDRMGRTVTVIDDATARELRVASHAGWHEYVGMADGHSRSYEPGTRVHSLVTDLFDHWLAAGFCRFVVGESGWDDAAAWWRDYPATTDLHVSAIPCRENDGSVRFAG